MHHAGRLAIIAAFVSYLSACQTVSPQPKLTGVGMTGVDYLADHLSVQDYWVNGRAGFQAGKGGSNVCCASVPETWYPGAQIEVRWEVDNWRKATWRCYRRMVPLDRYDTLGHLYVQFLPDGQVRAVLSDYVPWSINFPGTRLPIPKKEPWNQFPASASASAPTDQCPENQETSDE